MIEILSNESVLSALIQLPFVAITLLVVFVAFRAMRQDFNAMRADMNECQKQQYELTKRLVDAQIERRE